MLGNITKEDRKKYLEKARIAREEKKEAGKNLRQSFADENSWRQMASDIGFRLAQSHVPSTDVKYIRRLLKHLDRDTEWVTMVTGFVKLTDFAEKNKDWPCWAYQSLLIESYLGEKNEHP